MPPVGALASLPTAAWRTWGPRGLVRRGRYEAARRSGALSRAERRWPAPADAAPLRPVGTTPPSPTTPPPADPLVPGAPIQVYGGLDLPSPVPPDWHLHPLTGARYPSDAHWSTLSDARPDTGDIKDVWELARLGWLHPRLRHWAASGDDEAADTIWAVIEDWWARNPPYLGPHWMCAQETSLRTIDAVFLADALRASPASTPARHHLVARMVHDAVGRVAPTLGYALSQRNNHATSEAGFLWTATVLAPDLPGAGRIRRRAERALAEVAEDQFAPDGSYSQHSPTYHRVALHVLLWCLAVERATGERLPDGVAEAVGRSVGHLRSLLASGSEGRVPDLGGDDGALVFALAPVAIGDLRPVLAHAAAATDQASGLDAGPWDEEAAWFGLHRHPGPGPRLHPSITTHALTRGPAHAVLRAGPLAHRPAHADQLHVDVWLGGRPVAIDPGAYRYTAPMPWGNALAGEEVHNLPRRPGHPQAVRSGRFFWRRWTEATVEARVEGGGASALVARLDLAGATVRRLVVVAPGLVLVVDSAVGASLTVRWNLLADAVPEVHPGRTVVRGTSWRCELVHGAGTAVRTPDADDPTSGWWAPTYGQRRPLTAIEVPTDGAGVAIAAFTPASARVDGVVAAAAATDLRRFDRDALARVVTAAAGAGAEAPPRP